MRNSWLGWTFGLSGLVFVTAACSGDPDKGVVGDDGFGQDAGGNLGQVVDSGLGQNMSPVQVPDGGSAVIYSDASINGDMCVATKAVAPPASTPKVDIVWIVDSSASMFGEQKLIKENLAQFAEGITKSNLDVSIVMVSRTPSLLPADIPFLTDLLPICPAMPADPLAGTALAMDPRYHFVETTVDSNDVLTVAVNNYAQYQQFMRPGSAVHYIVVTDDEATYANGATPAARAMLFERDLTMKLGRPFQMHVIASPPGQRCSSPNCVPDPNAGACVFADLTCQAAAGGDTYDAIGKNTRGQIASICAPDWTPIFKMFQDAVIKSAPLPCDYTIPPPPKNENLDKAKVNVGYTPAGATAEEVLKKVANKDACGMNLGWHYDNEDKPGKVLLCPQACSKAAGGGTMNIAYGCRTLILE